MYRKSTILLVDDEEMIKRRLRDVIADDYEVLDASNGQEALEILAANIDRVAVIVLDLSSWTSFAGIRSMTIFR